MSQETHASGALARHLPTFLIVLMAIQPLMDILSFWTDRLGMSNTITLLLRFAVFAVVCVLGFVTSSRKKVYGIAIAACAFLLVGHCISCFIVGYQRIVYDLTNFVRVVQMPLFVLCFISFLRANNKCYRAFETGLMLDFWIITASVVVSVLTHTSSATYQSTNVGILGWYSFGNAQSAIMSILAPIVILLCYRRKNFLLFTVTSVAALAQLYLMGTRLAFFSIAVAALGVPIVLVLTGKARTSKRYIAVLVLILIACCATYKQSPMYINQNRYNEAMSYKQNEGAFLAGVLAASATKSDMEYANEDNVIGFVGAKDTAAVINDSAVGFIEGAQFVDPDVKVLVSYVDSATAKELAITQYSNGADVVFVAAGPASVGVIEAAAESKKYCIGVDSDQALAYEGKDEANFIISSAIKGVGDSIYNAVEKAVDGTLPYGEYQILGIEDGVVGLADNDIYQSVVSDDAKKAVEDAKEKLLAGEVTVDSAYGMDEATLKGIINGAQ